MRRNTNFADPSYEPTDEELAELMHEAFAGIKEAREKSLVEMRARIATARKAAVLELLQKQAKP